jgi:hypothetical protein
MLVNQETWREELCVERLINWQQCQMKSHCNLLFEVCLATFRKTIPLLSLRWKLYNVFKISSKCHTVCWYFLLMYEQEWESGADFSYIMDFEELHLLGYNAVYCIESQPAFQRNLSSPSSGPKNKPMKKPAWNLTPTFILVSCLAYHSTLKIEETCSSETSVDFQQTTRRHIPDDRPLHSHGCENIIDFDFLFQI